MHDEARRCYKTALELSERAGCDNGISMALLNLADLERAAGYVDQAVLLDEELRERMREDEGLEALFSVLLNLLGALLEQGRNDEAREVALECRQRISRLVLDEFAWTYLDGLALLHLRDDRTATATRLVGAADLASEQHGQTQRQPNEAADRAALDAALADVLGPAEITRLQAEGRRMSPSQALALNFDLQRPAAPR
jgi:tetratricopeptide (TPR) repeat protein